ncbi:MAG: NAD(P)/FAD-dependent oxidoreductase [Ornithinimicrobium sp.]|uniref:NAD(P)/FAD-dependent oxidoreductase n=1 Tax=Ornithinimicrobium sp. TaxID=1977084 RepID=UPI003D9B6442
MTQPSVAVVGAGISGLTAAYLLRESHRVTVYEVEPRLGGHTHTHDVTDAEGAGHAVDTGFIVHNDRTYPLLRALFAELGIEVRPTEMSMSISCAGCGLEYAGGRGAKGILAKPAQLRDLRFPRMLSAVTRFNRSARRYLQQTPESDLTSLGDWLGERGFDDYFVQHYAVPVVSCVWSSGHATALRYPARYLFRFLEHHGLLQLSDSPQWFTVVGGSRTYVDAIAARLPDVRTGDPVVQVSRDTSRGGPVTVRTAGGSLETYDQIVLATHADQALAMLADPTADEKRVLGSFGYSVNPTLLHTDSSLLPTAPRARSSWNYAMADCAESAAGARVSYWMNRLQGHESAQDLVVTLNDSGRVDPALVLARMSYTHPEYTPESVAAQAELPGLGSPNTAYAGAYHGWGFHEDGCRSGHAAADWTARHTPARASGAETSV